MKLLNEISRKALAIISHPSVASLACLWLIVLLVAGTLSQADHGLRHAQLKYFASWLFLPVDSVIIPMPGARLAMLVLSLGLAGRFLQVRQWRWRDIGIHVTHASALLLFIGGFITAYQSVEGGIALLEGQKADYFEDYHEVELVLTPETELLRDDSKEWNSDKSKANELKQKEYVFRQEDLQAGKILSFGKFEMQATDFFKNCMPEQRSVTANAQESGAKGFAKIFTLRHLPTAKENQRNRQGVALRLADSGDDELDGFYLLFVNMPIEQILRASDGREWRASLRKRRYALPFSLTLREFRKETHPGTDTARAFESEVEVEKSGLHENALIEMNRPLRFGGYTLYQASYAPPTAQSKWRELSVLAVVSNAGKIFPYLAGALMTLGLLIHILIFLRQKAESQAGRTKELSQV